MLVIGAVCDKCGRYEVFQNHSTKGVLVSMLRKKGWSIGKGRVRGLCEYTLCHMCRNAGKEV